MPATGEMNSSATARSPAPRGTGDAIDAVNSGRVDAAFYMRGTPVEQVQEVAETGVSMPPKSTYFFPKIPTGLLFNALD